MEQYKNFIFIPKHRIQIPSDISAESINPFSYVLDCVSFLFSQYIPTIIEKPLTVFIRCGMHDPQCVREAHAIFLNCEIFSWSQAAFQFAHELCHYCIPDDVPGNLRWLEESICQTASVFFLRRLTQFWKATSIQYRTVDGRLYADLGCRCKHHVGRIDKPGLPKIRSMIFRQNKAHWNEPLSIFDL